MTELERVTAAITAAMGEQFGCYSDRCCCFGAADVLECKLGITIEALAGAAIAAMGGRNGDHASNAP